MSLALSLSFSCCKAEHGCWTLAVSPEAGGQWQALSALAEAWLAPGKWPQVWPWGSGVQGQEERGEGSG